MLYDLQELLQSVNPNILDFKTVFLKMSLKKYVIEVKILIRCTKGGIVYVPRIPTITSDYSFEFRSIQFSINLYFAMTINKVQGKNLKITGIDNTDP